MEYIQLNQTNLLQLGIKDSKGNDTGKVLTFNLKSIDLFDKYQLLIDEDKKNRNKYKLDIKTIEKKQDHRSKDKILSDNEYAKINLLKNFMKKETEIYNIFLGENGVEKLLCGRDLDWDTLSEIDTIITDVILPKIKVNLNSIEDEIKNKYSKKEDDVLE